MRLKICICLLLLAAGPLQTRSQETDTVEKITRLELLRSTSADVERTFGRPTNNGSSKYLARFNVRDGKVDIEYSRGSCGGLDSGWNVPELTVIGIDFTFHKPADPARLFFTRDGFKKYPIRDVRGAFTFENKKLGINFDITETGKTEGFELYPSSDLDYLRCGASSQP